MTTEFAIDDAGAARMAALPAINDSASAALWGSRSLFFANEWAPANVTIAPRLVNGSLVMNKDLWYPYPKNSCVGGSHEPSLYTHVRSGRFLSGTTLKATLRIGCGLLHRTCLLSWRSSLAQRRRSAKRSSRPTSRCVDGSLNRSHVHFYTSNRCCVQVVLANQTYWNDLLSTFLPNPYCWLGAHSRRWALYSCLFAIPCLLRR